MNLCSGGSTDVIPIIRHKRRKSELEIFVVIGLFTSTHLFNKTINCN